MDENDKKRVRKSDTSFPLLITFDKAENKWVVLDGAHRLTKAVSENKKRQQTRLLGT